jgi:4,5-DOPA dioxygenase extradiol
MAELLAWARALPKPRAILIVSAHWESDRIGVTSSRPKELVYDFGGFAPMYYRMRYDTPDATEVNRLLHQVVPDGLHVQEHARGLDHGAWVPLKIMYPHADVPVLQLSLPTAADPEELMRLGGYLGALREQGVLIIGSGFMTHGLPYLTPAMMFGGEVPQWSRDFDAWAASALERGAIDELMNYQALAPAVAYAHPTVEHLTPIFITLGAAQNPTRVTTAIDGYAMGLSKRSFEAA